MAAGDLLVADLDAIRAAGRETSTIVVFTNADAIKSALRSNILVSGSHASCNW